VSNIDLEKALGDTIQAIENRKFKLPPDTAKAVTEALAVVRDIHLSGELREFSGYEYNFRLIGAIRKRLDYTAPPLVVNGYKIVERVLSYNCHMQHGGDRSAQQRADTVIQKLQVQIADKPQVFRDMAALYMAAYRELTPIDMFNAQGHPSGRAAAAAKKVAMQFTGQRREGMVRAILTDLRQIAQEIDRGLSN